MDLMPHSEILIGHTTTDGLDSEDIVHRMAPAGGNLVVLGPEGEVRPFRERFFDLLEEEALIDIIDADFAEWSLNTLRDEIQMQMDERIPTVVHVRNVDKAYTEQWDYVYRLMTQGYASNLSVYIEFSTFRDDRARMSVQEAWSVVILGQESDTDALVISRDASLPVSIFGPYIYTASLSPGSQKDMVPAVLA